MCTGKIYKEDKKITIKIPGNDQKWEKWESSRILLRKSKERSGKVKVKYTESTGKEPGQYTGKYWEIMAEYIEITWEI